MSAIPTITLDQARAAKATAKRQFKRFKIVGVGITRVGGEYAVKVNLSEPPAPGAKLPTEISGVPVRVEVGYT